MKLYNFLIILILSLTMLSATVYEDASDGSVERWTSLRNGEVSNIIDNGNRVISISGNRAKDAFVLGGKNSSDSLSWNNQSEKILKLRMKFDSRYYLFVYVQTLSGEVTRLRYSSSHDNELKNRDIRVSLGKASDDGAWVSVERNLEEDLKRYKPNDEIVAVYGLMAMGSGLIDDVELVGGEVSTPIVDAGSDKRITLGDSIRLMGRVNNLDAELYQWEENGVTLYSDDRDAMFTYTPTGLGSQILTLIVTDEDGQIYRDSMKVKVIEKEAPSVDDSDLNGMKFSRAGEYVVNRVSYRWGEAQEKRISWKMNFNARYYLYLLTETKNGDIERIRFSSSRDAELKRKIIRVSLGTHSDDGKWVDVSVDLEKELKKYKPDDSIVAIHGMWIQTRGSNEEIKEITFSSVAPTPPATTVTPFITKWNVLESDKFLKISTIDDADTEYNDLEYDFDIDWGDGRKDYGVKRTILHQYDKAGQYNVAITGVYPHPKELCSDYNEAGEIIREQHLLAIEQWGTQPWKSMKRAFSNCKELDAINDSHVPDFSHLNDTSYMFYGAESLTPDMTHCDLSNVSKMKDMFSKTEVTTENPTEEVFSSNIKMYFSFKGNIEFSKSLTMGEISSIETMIANFEGDFGFEHDMSVSDVAIMLEMFGMFKELFGMMSENFSKMDPSTIFQMFSMFKDALGGAVPSQ